MPRHPPCALNSLSHKHSTESTKTNCKDSGGHRHRSPGLGRRHYYSRDSPPAESTAGLSRDARVHYPVHKVQTHQGHQPRHGESGPGGPRAPTPPQRGRSPADSSKPNSVPSPVRSRGPQVPRPPPGNPAGTAVLRGPGDRAGVSSTVPLVNTTVPLTRVVSVRGVCSLERR
jgi:hypothetical protein